jgi:hypothetical protein
LEVLRENDLKPKIRKEILSKIEDKYGGIILTDQHLKEIKKKYDLKIRIHGNKKKRFTIKNILILDLLIINILYYIMIYTLKLV